MPRLTLTLLATIVVSLTLGFAGRALGVDGLAWLPALLLAAGLISLTDRDRFYGPPAVRKSLR